MTDPIVKQYIAYRVTDKSSEKVSIVPFDTPVDEKYFSRISFNAAR